MKRFTTLRLFVVGLMLAVTALTALKALAAEGHDHGAGSAASAQAASPRITAHSDLFELVGIVSAGQMLVYLDRFANNEPVIGAKLDFEAGSSSGTAVPQADGTYLIKLDALGKPGSTAFSFTVTAGTDTDLLAGEVSIAEGPANHSAAGAGASLRWLTYGLVALGLLAGTAFLFRRLRSKRRSFN